MNKQVIYLYVVQLDNEGFICEYHFTDIYIFIAVHTDVVLSKF